MRLLVATKRGQGDRPDDYCFAADGEPVTPLLPDCTVPAGCGCRRGFDGLHTDRATTTALVTERNDLSPDGLLALLDAAVARARVVAGGAVVPAATEQFEEIERLASSFPVGTIVRRDGRCYTAGLDQAGAA